MGIRTKTIVFDIPNQTLKQHCLQIYGNKTKRKSRGWVRMTPTPHNILRKLFDHCLASLVELKSHSLDGKGLEINFLEWKVRITTSCCMRLMAPI